jgi:hypothetical protein
LNGKETWDQTRQVIQSRQIKADLDLTVKNSRVLWAAIFQLLNAACDDGILATTQAELRGLLKITPQPKQGKNVIAVMVGAATKNFKRDPTQPHLRRRDGAWFDFSILVDETQNPAAIIGFDFELRFPEGLPTAFLRYDLNTPGHNNQDDGLRFHIHPGSDDLMIHSGPLTPIEILQQFLYGLPIPVKPRTIGKSRPQSD